MFGFVNDLSASLRCERAGKFFFVFGVAGLDVVIGNGIEEVALVIIHQVVYPTARGQSLVAAHTRHSRFTCSALTESQIYMSVFPMHEHTLTFIIAKVQLFIKINARIIIKKIK